MDFKERLNKIAERNSKVKHAKNAAWPMEKKIEVVSQWLVLGNLRMVSAITGVGYELIRAWRGQPWWAEVEAEIRASQNIEMDTKLSQIIDRSLDATLDRVENGDFIYDQKSGEIRRKPANLRDVHKVAIDSLGKRELLRTGADDRGENTKVSVEEQLKMLAMNLEKWVRNQQPVIELEEVQDALYEEREAGLQEGTGVGTREEAGEGEGASGTERGSRYFGEGRESPQG